VTGARSALRGAVLARAALTVLTARPPGGAARWRRANHRGGQVTLLAGPALAAAAALSADLPEAAAAVAVGGALAVGAYDDAVGTSAARGLRGHLAAVQQGRGSTGAVKVVGLGAAGLAACALLEGTGERRRLLTGGAVVAGTANLLNLLDVRPGRALKAGAAAAVLLGQPGPAAAAAALLPDDLHERTMLGDAGANGLGALLGLALLHGAPRRRGTALLLLVALTLASEVVPYSRVIDAVPLLRWVDRAGRRP
jgi:UDP-GlcNAc:undecaprenyl-phosphate/decaprenyl-phosphate GlcNAc-1-phosphate transferase